MCWKILTQCNSHNILWNKSNVPSMYHHYITKIFFETHVNPFLTLFCDVFFLEWTFSLEERNLIDVQLALKLSDICQVSLPDL